LAAWLSARFKTGGSVTGVGDSVVPFGAGTPGGSRIGPPCCGTTKVDPSGGGLKITVGDSRSSSDSTDSRLRLCMVESQDWCNSEPPFLAQHYATRRRGTVQEKGSTLDSWLWDFFIVERTLV